MNAACQTYDPYHVINDVTYKHRLSKVWCDWDGHDLESTETSRTGRTRPNFGDVRAVTLVEPSTAES